METDDPIRTPGHGLISALSFAAGRPKRRRMGAFLVIISLLGGPVFGAETGIVFRTCLTAAMTTPRTPPTPIERVELNFLGEIVRVPVSMRAVAERLIQRCLRLLVSSPRLRS